MKRFERFLRGNRPPTPAGDITVVRVTPLSRRPARKNPEGGETEDLFPEPDHRGSVGIPASQTPAKDMSLLEVFERDGNGAWLDQKKPNAEALTAFNKFNKELHPNRAEATGLAIFPVKGSSMEGQRLACLTTSANLRAGESRGEIVLTPEPTNIYDPSAVAIHCRASGERLGYVPKQAGLNGVVAQALERGEGTGGYIVRAKRSMLKSQDNVMLIVATGWITPGASAKNPSPEGERETLTLEP